MSEQQTTTTKSTTTDATCPACGQDLSAPEPGGEYPCRACGRPTLHDDPTPEGATP